MIGPWTVKICQQAYNTILLHAKTYAKPNLPPQDWKIVLGFLCGTIQNEALIVYKAIPMIHGSYTSVSFSEEDYIDTARITMELKEQDYFLLGWYHSHPGKGLFLHDIDVVSQLGYQGTNPAAFALVIDPALVGPDSFGIEVFALDDPDLGALSGYHSIKWEIEGQIKDIQIDGPVLRELKKKELE